MEYELDLTNIKKLSIEKNKENWEFRAFLKHSDHTSKEIDSLVHKLYEEISSKIDCKICANCCKEVRPLLDDKDINTLSKCLKVSADQFVKRYMVRDADLGGLTFNKTPCPFLKANLCMCYECRPNDCSSFPHLHKEHFVFKLTQVVQNYSICPIIFNVYESLKTQIWK